MTSLQQHLAKWRVCISPQPRQKQIGGNKKESSNHHNSQGTRCSISVCNSHTNCLETKSEKWATNPSYAIPTLTLQDKLRATARPFTPLHPSTEHILADKRSTMSELVIECGYSIYHTCLLTCLQTKICLMFVFVCTER